MERSELEMGLDLNRGKHTWSFSLSVETGTARADGQKPTHLKMKLCYLGEDKETGVRTPGVLSSWRAEFDDPFRSNGSTHRKCLPAKFMQKCHSGDAKALQGTMLGTSAYNPSLPAFVVDTCLNCRQPLAQNQVGQQDLPEEHCLTEQWEHDTWQATTHIQRQN